MLNTKNLVVTESEVPSYWVFNYYLNLNEQLTGQNIKIKSIFNPNEKTPSMCIYVDKSTMQYKFKDFSTGSQGGKIDLIKILFNLNYINANNKIIEDYNKYIINNGCVSIEIEPEIKWNVDFVKTRDWYETDKTFWLSYGIGSNLLNEYNVKPIEYYNMVKEKDNEVKKFKIENSMIYGYFTNNNTVYKIYQPLKKRYKFLKIIPYLQGIDQLKYNKPYLVICSSLKDAMCLKSFGYNLEVIAPDSENTIIKPYIIENLKSKYKKIITLFDNDQAGHKAIKKYEELYNINGFSLDKSKDISDSINNFGWEEIHKNLKPLLKKTLHKL